MKSITSIASFWGTPTYWWSLLILGLLFIGAGFWIVYSPMVGYATISFLFGWLLLVGGIVQIGMTKSLVKEHVGWGWWLAGGIFDFIIGLILVFDLALAEITLPYFFAFIFLFKGITHIVGALGTDRSYRYWWFSLINGILMVLLSWIFFFSPGSAAYTIVILCAFAFIYWGVTLILFGYTLRPKKEIQK